MIAESSYKMSFFVLVIQKIVLRFYAFSIWHEDNAGQTCASSICMLHIFCGGSVSTTIKHNIAVSVFKVQMFFV